MNLNLKMDNALVKVKLAKAVSHIDALINSASSSSETRSLLTNHTIKNLPTFHYLAHSTLQTKDIPHLDKLIKIFTDAGYDINKRYPLPRIRRSGFTALLESIWNRNTVLLDCLLKHGARTDIRDNKGFSPAHWAIKVGDVQCLEKLVKVGGPSVLATTSIEKSEENHVHPLLHTAVDQGCVEMVLYLLSKTELGVDVNEETVYRSRWCDREIEQYSYKVFTPLRRAVYNETIPIIEALMTHPGIKPDGFEALHYFLQKGYTEMAWRVLNLLSDLDLSTDKIEDRWALHCIPEREFSDEGCFEFTKNLILEYVRRGWDANSVSHVKKLRLISVGNLDRDWCVAFSSYTLLHLACAHKAAKIIKLLVEELGVDVNGKSEGELSPLQILLLLQEWETASYLIEKGANLSARGRFNIYSHFTRFLRTNVTTGNLELDSTFNAVDLLLRMGDKEGLPLLVQVLATPEVVLHGGNAFRLAVEGRNLAYISKVLQHCSTILSKEDLSWVTEGQAGTGWQPEKVPSIIWLLNAFKQESSQLNRLFDVITLLVKLGCDLNISWKKKNGYFAFEMEPLIFYILRYDLDHRTSNRLLKTFLQFDRFQINETDVRQWNPVEFLLNVWNQRCLNIGPFRHGPSPCAGSGENKQNPIMEAIQLLVGHGLDVSGMTILPFDYHEGSGIILQMLYHAGAKISEEFFTSARVCRRSSRGYDALTKEIKEWKDWKDEFDRNTRLSLQRYCCLQIRKMLKPTTGNLKILDELPKCLKEDVLATTYL